MGRQPSDAGAVSEDSLTARDIRLVFIALMVVLGLGAIDQSVVATALPRIVSDLGGVANLSWVVTAYVLASTSTMPLYGKLSDQYGRKPVLNAAILIFLLGSALSGTSQSLLQLIIWRAVQGLGAGGLLPLAQTIIGDIVSPAERGRRQGTIVAVFAICSVIGPVVGGLITDFLSWHWIFYINLPLGFVSLFIVDKALRYHQQTRRRTIDYAGAALLTGSTTAFLLLLTLGGSVWPWMSMPVGVCTALAVILAVLLVIRVRHAPEPVLPPLLFRNRLFVVASTVLAFTFMGMLGVSLFFPLFFQSVEGIRPSNSGFLTGPLMLGVVVSSVFNGRVLLRSGRYKPAQIVGLTLGTASFAALAWSVAAARSLVVIEPILLCLGLGLGLVMPNMTVAVQNALPPEHRGVGTATLAFFRSLGGLVGAAGAGAIFASQIHPLAAGAAMASRPVLVPAYRHAIATVMTAGVGVMALALLALLFLPEVALTTSRPAPTRP